MQEVMLPSIRLRFHRAQMQHDGVQRSDLRGSKEQVPESELLCRRPLGLQDSQESRKSLKAHSLQRRQHQDADMLSIEKLRLPADDVRHRGLLCAPPEVHREEHAHSRRHLSYLKQHPPAGHRASRVCAGAYLATHHLATPLGRLRSNGDPSLVPE
ncbi:Uncharacterised protein [Chlamydia trachomatis]|nr:Uncharacterised protein [Chlamydia trachomatis]